MKRPIEDTVSLLAGAGLGVAMMYLFDPDMGRQRRQRARAAAREGVATAGDYAQSAFDTFSQRAGDVAESLRNTGSDWTASAREASEGLGGKLGRMTGASALFDAARDQVSGLRDRFSQGIGDTYESARDTKRRWVRSAADTLGAEPEHRYLGQTMCALGSLALGAGLLWAFDPRSGRSRRARLSDQTGRVLRDTGDFFRRTGKYMAGRMRGTVAETRGMVQSRWQPQSSDDQTLCARVRSELGRVVQNMRGIDVQARDGYVVLIGELDGSELDSAANLVLGIRGVRGLDNRLRARGTGSSPSNISFASSPTAAG
jgi:hypothetical protein